MASNIPSIDDKFSVVRFEENKAVEDQCIYIDETLTKLDLWTRDTVEPAAVVTVLEKIRAGSTCVTITGSPGEGKSTLGFWVLKSLQSTGNVFEVRYPEHFAGLIRTSAPVILLDDIFGQTVFNEEAWQIWKESIEEFMNMKEYRPVDEIGKLVLILRDSVLTSGPRHKDKTWKMLTDDMNVVNISHEFVRDNQEKHNILISIAKNHNLHLDSNTMRSICCTKTPSGFPQACKLFVRFYQKDSTISSLDFFNEPLQFLKNSLNIAIRDEIIERIFLEMMNGDGFLSNFVLNELGSTYIKTAQYLCTWYMYIKPDGDGYVCDHPSILDTVATLLCETKSTLLLILEHCSMEFIRERVWLQTPDGEKINETDDGAKLMTEIPWNEANALVERFRKEIEWKDARDVTYHNAWTSDMFVKLLIENIQAHQLDDGVTEAGYTVFHLICQDNRAECLKLCLPCLQTDEQKDAYTISASGKTVLHVAAEHGYTDCVRVLFEWGIDVNFLDMYERTSLHVAAEQGHTYCVRQLLEFGANASVNDSTFGQTALHVTAEFGHADCVRELLKWGVNVNVKDVYEQTPLHMAAEQGHTYCICVLLEFGANASIKDAIRGQTALHIATEHGHADCVCVLLERGVGVNIEDNIGRTALDYAIQYEEEAIAIDLQAAGCKSKKT